MAHLIDKDALVAKIGDWQHNIMMGVATIPLHGHQRADATFEYEIFGLVKDFLNTLEVKDVDLNEEIERFVKSEEFQKACGTIRVTVLIAKHFFELGLLSTITEEDCKLIWNIGDDLPYMPEEDFFGELLRRYKARKGE